RGRKSAANLAVIPLHPSANRVQPPSDLRKNEAELFRTIVNSVPADHFVPSDIPLLVSYVRTTLKLTPKISSLDWERLVRAQALLARNLRLTPRSRTDPKTLARKLANQRPLSVYETMGVEDE